MRVGNVFVQLLLNKCPCMFAMIIIYVVIMNDYKKFKYDNVNSEYTVANSKYYHFSYTQFSVLLIVITSTKLITKLL
jgi:hypothetical protein